MEETKPRWTPSDRQPHLGKFLAAWSMPAVAPFNFCSRCPPSVENARWWRTAMLCIGGALGSLFHYYATKWSRGSRPAVQAAAHVCVFLTFEHPFLWMGWISHALGQILSMKRSNRILDGRLHGPRVVVIGNGPSACEGEKRGHLIDQFDEVVRFNNFQAKSAGMVEHVGKKTTVHVSDGTLFPTFEAYHAPGATIILSLFQDRHMVAGAYLIMRAGTDLQPTLAYNFFTDPAVGWFSHERIHELKKNLGLVSVKHPTSGMLAIDHFVRQEGVQLPVYIHGFDFFQGPKIHYYDEKEPKYERFLNHVGVNMHSPLKEKAYVEKLIAEGKVRFLKDM